MIKQNFVKATALFLTFSLFQLYVQVSARGQAAQDPATSAPQTAGLLSTTHNRNILVDKNEASTGATILDGQTLETSDCVSATVRFGPLDQVDLATNTIAVINHSDGKVKVTLKKGCARVRVQRSVDGTIETPDGKTTPATQPDPPNRQLAEVCYLLSGTKGDFNPSCPVAGFPPIFIGGIVAGVVGAVALAVVSSGASVGAENASDSAPS